MLLSIPIIIVLVSLISFALWYYPKWFEHSSELDAGVVTGIVSIVVLVGTIGVTVAVNMQTQRMALKMNQENQQLQLKIQEMNMEAMRFQARATLRDEVLKQRFPAYRKLLKSLSNFEPALESISTNVRNNLRIDRNMELLIKKDAECIKVFSDVISEIEKIYVNSCYEYSQYISNRIDYLIGDAKQFRHHFFNIVKADEDGYINLDRDIETNPLDGFFANINMLIVRASHDIAVIKYEMKLKEIEQDIDSLNLKHK